MTLKMIAKVEIDKLLLNPGWNKRFYHQLG